MDWLAHGAVLNIHIRIRPEAGGKLAEEMRDGSVDLALDYFAQRDSSFHNECVITEDLLTLSRLDHPQVKERLSLETYHVVRHVGLTPRTDAMPLIDLALSKRGLRRHIAVEVPHFLSMPLMVQASNPVRMPKRMAHLYADHFRLKAHAVPLRVPDFPIFLIWHSSADNDPAHRWLRDNLMEFCQRLERATRQPARLGERRVAITASAHEAMRLATESERLVSTMGTCMPSTRPAHSAPAM